MCKDHTLLGKMVVQLTLFALVPTLLLMMFLQRNNQNAVAARERRMAAQAAEQVERKLNTLRENIESAASIVSTDPTLRKASRVLRRGATIGEEIDSYRELCQLITMVAINGNVDASRLYLPDSRLVTRERVNLFGFSDLENTHLPPNMQGSRVSSGWTTGDDGALAFYFRGVYKQGDMRNGPIIMLSLSHERIDEMIAEMGYECSVSLSTQYEQLFSYGHETKGEERFEFTGGAWDLVISMPLEQFAQAQTTLVNPALGAVMMMAVAIPILASTVSRPLARTVNELAKAKQAIVRQEYVRLPEDSNVHELRVLQQSHNQMIDSIQKMIRDVYEVRHERDQTELTSLFEQVKPHFLYNTLDGGKWLALHENAPRTAEFLERLSAFYRIGLNKSSVFVPLEREISHVREYVELMKLRYGDRIELETDIAPECENVQVLKLLLQPLVENAIEHGVHGSESEGLIRVSARLIEKRLRLCVADNGVGMSEEQRSRFNRDGQSSGYGLENVYRRLKIYYGENAQIRLEEPDKGGLAVCIEIRTSDEQKSGKN